MYRIKKTFGAERGISCAFRQWRATSHCRFIHGYALSFEFGIVSEELDENNWCYDFGGFKRIETSIRETFDHKLVVAQDDPELPHLVEMYDRGLCQVVILPSVGCEAFARHTLAAFKGIVTVASGGRAALAYVTVSEHGSNSATYAEA